MKLRALNVSRIESKWQRKWKRAQAFESAVDRTKPKLFFTTPYPYISGSLHLGHGRAVTEGDVYTRYKRMSGYNVLSPMGFHISGTPVLGISAAIKQGDADKISLYESYVRAYVPDPVRVREIVRSFEDPQAIVDFFIPKMMSEYQRLGLAIDWRRSFTSGDMEHQQLVSWQFEEYRQKGYLIKSKYPVLYSPTDESAMGEDDIKDADSEAVEKMEFTLLKFKFGERFLVAATLRPETIYGQTNLWINPTVQYVQARVGTETWIMSAAAYEKLTFQRTDISESSPVTDVLIGSLVEAPLIDRSLMILPSRFVDGDVGSGIVTSVPSDAPYDYIALRELQADSALMQSYGLDVSFVRGLTPLPIITTKKYGDRAGVTSVDSLSITTQDDPRLESLTAAVYKEGFHSGTLLSSCGPYAGLKVTVAKDQIKHDLLNRGVASTMYETSRKAYSRSGGKIIVAVLDNQWFLDFNAPGWKEKARACLDAMTLLPDSNRRLFIDTFSWLDKRPCARKRGLGTMLPFDTNWVIESLSDSTIYMTLYPIRHLIKQHKLKRRQLRGEFFRYVYLGEGELTEVARITSISETILTELRDSFIYWMPLDHRHTFNLHLSNHLSFMIFAFSGLFPEQYWPKKISFHGLIISEGSKMSKSKGNVITLLDIQKKYGADVFRHYITSSTVLEGTFDWREQEAQNAQATVERVYTELISCIRDKSPGSVSAYYESKFNLIKKRATESLESMKLRDYNQAAIHDMLGMIRQAKLMLSTRELAALYDSICLDWIKLLCPVIPHLAEELWSMAAQTGFVSLASWPLYDSAKINPEFIARDVAVEQTLADIKNVMNIVQVKQSKAVTGVYLYVMPFELEYYPAAYLSKRLNIPLNVYAVNDPLKVDPEGKSAKAKPGKPGIYVL